MLRWNEKREAAPPSSMLSDCGEDPMRPKRAVLNPETAGGHEKTSKGEDYKLVTTRSVSVV